MGAFWGLAWGLVGGFIMEAFVDPRAQIVDMWPQVLAIPGFFGGALFSGILFAAGRRRKFEDLSLPLFGALGAISGLLLGVLFVATVSALGAGLPPFWVGAAVVGTTTLLSATSAAGSLALARFGSDRVSIDAGAAADDKTLGEGKGKKRLPR
jgi:hypothetical protein